MALTTYHELQAAVLRWLARDDLSDTVPDLIALGENRLFNGAGDPLPSEPLRLWRMRSRNTLTAGLDGSVALAPSLLSVIAVYRPGEPARALDATSPDALRRLYPFANGGLPVVYAIETNNAGAPAIVTRPALAHGDELVVEAYARPPALADGGDLSSSVFRAEPQLHLYAALIEAAPFLLEDSRVALWHGLFQAGVAGANRVDAQRRRGAGTSIMRVVGGTP